MGLQTQGTPSIERFSKHDERETQVSSSSLRLALKEVTNAEIQSFLAQHILIGGEYATIQGAFASTIHLPETVVLGLYKTHKMQVNTVIGGWRGCVASCSRALVGAFERFRLVQQIGTLSRLEGNSIFQQLRKARFWICSGYQCLSTQAEQMGVASGGN